MSFMKVCLSFLSPSFLFDSFSLFFLFSSSFFPYSRSFFLVLLLSLLSPFPTLLFLFHLPSAFFLESSPLLVSLPFPFDSSFFLALGQTRAEERAESRRTCSTMFLHSFSFCCGPILQFFLDLSWPFDSPSVWGDITHKREHERARAKKDSKKGAREKEINKQARNKN